MTDKNGATEPTQAKVILNSSANIRIEYRTAQIGFAYVSFVFSLARPGSLCLLLTSSTAKGRSACLMEPAKSFISFESR